MVLAEHYAGEASRLFEASRIDRDLELAQRLLTWLGTWGEDLISLPDIYQRGPNAIPDARTARKLAGILVDHGWLFPVESGGVVKGQRREEVWQIMRAPA